MRWWPALPDRIEDSRASTATETASLFGVATRAYFDFMAEEIVQYRPLLTGQSKPAQKGGAKTKSKSGKSSRGQR